METTPYLESPRLTLYPLSEGDAGLFVDLDSDPEVMRFLSGGKPTSLEDAEATLKRVLGYKTQFQGRYGTWPAIEKSTGETIGWFLLRPDKEHLDNEKDLEIGYRLKKKFWGRGYATEVSHLLMAKAFNELGAETVFASAMRGNDGSIGVMKKIGMKFVTDYQETRFSGEDQLAVRYRITRAEWVSFSGQSAAR